MHQLVDAGYAIGTIAEPSTGELRGRLQLDETVPEGPNNESEHALRKSAERLSLIVRRFVRPEKHHELASLHRSLAYTCVGARLYCLHGARSSRGRVAAMRTCRLIYRSTARPDTLDTEKLEALQQECESNNARLDVKGLLVVSGQHFLQVLEGPPRFVNEIFVTIVQDPRHHDVELISYEGTAKPHFFDWNMRLVTLAELSANVRDMFNKKYPSRDDTVAIPDDPLLVHSLLLDVKYALR